MPLVVWRNWLQIARERWWPRVEFRELLAVLFVVGAVWSFVELAELIEAGSTQRFDESIVDSLRRPDQRSKPRGPDWLLEVGRDLTALGGPTVLTLVTVATAGYLLLIRKRYAMVLMLLAVISGVVLSTLLKDFFGRERPAGGSALTTVMSYSFPSGHSLLSAIVYLVLGTMLASTESRRAIRVYFMTVALLLTLVVGVSRVLMLVHYPTDVLGGWTAGLAWAVVWWLIACALQHRGAIEPPGNATPAAQSGG